MRRSDREITDENTIKNFIENESIIRIAFCDDGDIYNLVILFKRQMAGRFKADSRNRQLKELNR